MFPPTKGTRKMTIQHVSDDLARRTQRLRGATLEAIEALEQATGNPAVSHDDRAGCLEWLHQRLVLCERLLMEHRRQNPPLPRRRTRDTAVAIA
jgi:hypothetical protein